jgi:hypothetical protein
VAPVTGRSLHVGEVVLRGCALGEVVAVLDPADSDPDVESRPLFSAVSSEAWAMTVTLPLVPVTRLWASSVSTA